MLDTVAEDRWDRVAKVTTCLSVIFVALALHGIWEGDSVVEVVMELAPGLLLFGISRLAVSRRDQLADGTLCWIQRIGALALVAIGVLYLGYKVVWGFGHTVGQDLAFEELEQDRPPN